MAWCRTSLLWLFLALPVLAADPITDPIIVFGYSPDDSPVSSFDKEIVGFCGALYKYLEQYRDEQGKSYMLQARAVGIHERFGVFASSLEGKPGIQCGAHSITRQRIEHLQRPDQGFVGSYSHPFAITATKILIRTAKRNALYENPSQVRIGILKPSKPVQPVMGSGLAEPTTSVLIEGVFPNAIIVPLQDRGDATRRLRKVITDPNAIDAYVSTDILLQDVLRINLAEVQAAYSIEPPSSDGFARQQIGVVVYNAPDLLKYINQWIDSSASSAARAPLVPKTDIGVETLTWLNRSTAHLAQMHRWLVGLAVLLVGSIGILGFFSWRLWQQQRLPIPSLLLASEVPLPPETSLPTETPLPIETSLPPETPLPPETLLPTETPQILNTHIPPPTEPSNTPPETTTLTSGNVPTVSLLPLGKTPTLSRRETEVLRLLAQGKQSGEIARVLEIETRTVEAHRQNLRIKLGLRNTAELTRYAIENNV